MIDCGIHQSYVCHVCYCLGKCATYGQYTVMDAASGTIIASVLLDKRETRGRSVTLELFGFIRCLHDLIEAGVAVTKFVTDDHTQIRKFFRKLLKKNRKNNTY